MVAAAGAVARAFAGASVTGGGASMLTPSVLFLTGYRLIDGGEAVFLIGGEKLFPVTSWDIEGTYDPATWRYSLQLAGPSRESTKTTVAGDRVVHVALSTDGRTWRGQSPVPALTAGLLAEVELALQDEAKGPRGTLLPYPTDSGSAVQQLTDSISKLCGRLALGEIHALRFGRLQLRPGAGLGPAAYRLRCARGTGHAPGGCRGRRGRRHGCPGGFHGRRGAGTRPARSIPALGTRDITAALEAVRTGVGQDRGRPAVVPRTDGGRHNGPGTRLQGAG